jgi:SAM-dependent methyltransferase
MGGRNLFTRLMVRRPHAGPAPTPAVTQEPPSPEPAPYDSIYPFDVAFYRGRHPELAMLTDAEAASHYLTYGIAEGRQGHPSGVRPTFTTLVPAEDPVLEIGPFANPTIKGPNVRYADVLDTDQLRARAVEIGIDPEGCPHIYYPLPTLDLGTINERFAAVVSSHNIEHQPDLIRHLQAIEKLLEPGGRYFLLVPDKRYCFDHFLPETSIADVMSAYMRKPTFHDIGSVIEHWALTTHNDPGRHWLGDHGRPHLDQTRAPLERAISECSVLPQRYIDVHAWQFTPQSFAQLFGVIADLGLSKLRPLAVYPTLHNSQEFCAILG